MPHLIRLVLKSVVSSVVASVLSSGLILTTSLAFAQGAGPGEPIQIPASQPSAATSAPTSSQISAPFKFNAPQFGFLKLKAGIKSLNASARLAEFDNKNGRRYQQKHEYYAGFVYDSGWGLYGQAVTSGTLSAGQGVDHIGAGDPSVTFLHPDWLRARSLTLGGQFRSFFPATDRSQDRQLHQQAYYFYTTYKMAALWSLWNQTVPRWFEQAYYKPTDTRYVLEDLGTLSKQVSEHWALGVGQWTQVESHDQTETGVSVDVEAFARYVPIQNIWIEPRLILPAYIKNAVYDQAKTVSLPNARVELYAQLSL